ncbi:hypothetical protein B0T10DRAFT_500883 [Thelonectria olida]|uniref:Uncharacterized protein n=1 Tax=Thelonectria olida TaxID=1576542 RepID=A0A9P8VS50_9HYPO|nr:hypothetical protein B0T10DRAFT_500883 [Thelonectria olida]
MTGRGPCPERLPPRDPSLETHPVPRTRQFSVHSVGPGADPDIRQKVCPIKEIDARIGYQPGPEFDDSATTEEMAAFFRLSNKFQWCNEMRGFLRDIEWEGNVDFENGEPFDPTWGVCVLVTSYTEEALQKLDAALSTLTEAVRRFFLRYIDEHSEAYVLEILKRFKLDVVTDKNVLENASDDRVREEFNAHIGHLHFWPLDEEEYPLIHPRPSKDELVLNRPPCPVARFAFCIVLDEAKIVELSNVEFAALGEDEQRLQDVTVKVIDRKWDYEECPDYHGSYQLDGVTTYVTGADQCPIWKIGLVYSSLKFYRCATRMFPMTRYEKNFGNF